MAFWNLVDWISIFFALMIILRFALLVVATANTNDLLGNHVIGLTSNADEPPGQVLPRVEAVYDAVAAMLESEESFRFQLCLYPTVLMLRLFKSFAAQPRLAVITSTFVKAGSDIFHFGIVFCAVYCCMTVNAVLFFGQDSQDFATFWRSFHSCFLVMFGDWDYEQMEQVGRVKASLWFWMFQIIVVLILQNIMLAILMEAYTRVKLGSANSISLLDQINKQMRRWSQARKGQRVRLNDIWDALKARELAKGSSEEKMLQSSDKIFPHQLLPMVKNIMEAQVVRTLTDSQRDHDLLHEPSFSTEDMMDNLKTMRSKADNTLMCAAYTSHKVCEYDVAEEELLEDFKDKDAYNESVNSNHFYSRTDTEQERAKRVATRRKHILEETQARFHRELETVRQHTQSRTADLSHAVGGVLGEEIGALERRQKEQLKTTEQVQASLQSLKSLAYKVNATVSDVCKISDSAFRESADLILPGSFENQEGPDG